MLDKRLLAERSHLNRKTAGAGIVGAAVMFLLLIGAMFLALANSFFLSMLLCAIAILIYLSGTQIYTIIYDSFKIFVTHRHIVSSANELIRLQNWLDKTLKGEDASMDQSELQSYVEEKINSDADEAEKIKTEIEKYYFSNAHEHYSYNAYILEFTGNVMPLFGLIGTVFGLIQTFATLDENVSISDLGPSIGLAMQTTLFAAILSVLFKVMASRFRQQIHVLEYAFEEVLKSVELLGKYK